MREKLAILVHQATQDGNAERFLKAVRDIVYGQHGYDSVYRIDHCEVTSKRVFLRVSNRLTGALVYSVVQKQASLRRVA